MGYGKRAKEYESAINYLVENQLVCRSYKIRQIKSPLSSCREVDSFKLYMIDDGILFSMLHLNRKSIQTDESIKETLYENHIAKTLMEAGCSLYYYQSGGKAEVNFVVQNNYLLIEVHHWLNNPYHHYQYKDFLLLVYLPLKI